MQITFSGTATTASCVAVEYSGADIYYPLDSASAGYSYTAGSTLDSGTSAPANASLLVFGGGTSDTGTAIAGSGFTNIQSSGGSITEQYIPSSANNVLQRATACLGTGMTCSPLHNRRLGDADGGLPGCVVGTY